MQIIKKVIIILFPILLLFIASVIFIYAGLHTESVRDGITLECAQRIVEHGSDYYIVTESGEMGIEFQISYGLDKGIDVALTGNAPLMYLNHAFFQSKHNSFLIKGKVYNEQYKGNTYYESYPEILSIEVESWEIITPIGRDYTYEKHGRLIYPTNYLDKYDVEHGDYVPDGKY